MKEKILQALTTSKGYLFSSDKWLHLAAGFIIAFFVGLFGVFYGLCAGIAAARERALRQIQQEGNPGSLGLHFFGSRCSCRCP